MLDAVRIQRRPHAAVKIAVALAEDGVISKHEALMRIAPDLLTELLHRQVDPEAERDVLAHGIAASPGAATGAIVFDAAEAQYRILLEQETTRAEAYFHLSGMKTFTREDADLKAILALLNRKPERPVEPKEINRSWCVRADSLRGPRWSGSR